jgi:sec-independent protein translocase protein TatA
MLGNVGPLEILVVLIIALVVFGPKRLPELGNSLGKGIREFRDTVTGDHRDDEDADAKTLAATQATTAPPVAQPASPPEPPAAAVPPVEPPAQPEVVDDKRS